MKESELLHEDTHSILPIYTHTSLSLTLSLVNWTLIMSIRNLKHHAKTTLLVKGNPYPNSKQIQRTKSALNKAYNTIYKGVAFDIDGTLTKPKSYILHEDAIQAIVDLLHKGVPVLLITGRGRNSARDAVRQIINSSGVDFLHLTLLSVITHNGVLWLRSKTNTYISTGCISDILNDEKALAPTFTCVTTFLYELYSDKKISQAIINRNVTITEEPSENPRGIRVVINNDTDRSLVEHIRNTLFETKHKCTEQIYITEGRFGSKISFDIYNTNKVHAINLYCEMMGFKLNELLRIGDKGGEDGNDYEFLNSSKAFSVQDVSPHPTRCFPVLDDQGETQLTGIDATKALLGRVKILPPLTLYPSRSEAATTFEESFFSDLLMFEKNALRRSRQERHMLFQSIKTRIKRLINDNRFDIEDTRLEDIFEPLNGGIRIWDWELTEIEKDHPILRLFGISKEILSQPYKIKFTWSIPTDENILLRGPHYYWAMTNSNRLSSPDYLSAYTEVSLSYIESSLAAIKNLLDSDASFVKFKLVLGVMDNVRNILLQWLYATYKLELPLNTDFPYTRSIFNECILPHTEIFVDALLNSDLYWNILIFRYLTILESINRYFKENANFYAEKFNPANYNKPIIRKWREADNFLENVLALEIGLHELGERFLQNESFVVTGLVYGGLELAVIAQVIGEKKQLHILPAIAELSLYGNKNVRYDVLKGKIDEDYFDSFKESFERSFLFLNTEENLPENCKVVLVDDNCTTCRTLGLARDWLENQGHRVEGAVVVRYPGSNRYLQMKMPNHGAPNPRMFLTFVRGLVTPSPYTRLMKDIFNSDINTIYLDKTEIFDLSKAKIQRYLNKGDTK